MSDEPAAGTPTAGPAGLAADRAEPHRSERAAAPAHDRPTEPSAESPPAPAHDHPPEAVGVEGAESERVTETVEPPEHGGAAGAGVPHVDEPTPPKKAKKARPSKAPKADAEAPPEQEPGHAAEPEHEPEAPAASATPAEPPAEPVPENKKKWYAIKVQSGREDSIKAAILRKVRIEGLEEFFGRIEIPFEEVSEKKTVKVKDKKTGETTFQEKKVTRKRKKFQGYLFAELEFNDRILYLFRETSGVGDFLNLRQKPGLPPTPEPMPDHEVQSMLTGVAVRNPNMKVKVKLDFEKGDKVRIRDGSFANSEGEVKSIIEAKDPNEAPKVMVVLTFWGRPLDVELDSSQVEKV